MLMGIKEIQEIIPHRHPFLLVDCIEELEPGVRAVATRPSPMMSLLQRPFPTGARYAGSFDGRGASSDWRSGYPVSGRL